MFLSCLISFAQYPKKNLKVYLSRQCVYVFLFSNTFWIHTRVLDCIDKGARPWENTSWGHPMAFANQISSTWKDAGSAVYLYSYFHSTVLQYLFYYATCSWGFLTEFWKSHAPSHPLTLPGVQSRMWVTLDRGCTGRTGEAELMCYFWGKTCCTKLVFKTHKWERNADKNFSTPESVIFNFKTFCERCWNSVDKYKTIS